MLLAGELDGVGKDALTGTTADVQDRFPLKNVLVPVNKVSVAIGSYFILQHSFVDI